MKIAVLADIHANLPALEAVTADLEVWNPDRVILAGDVVNRGPRSLACLMFVMGKIKTNGWQVLKGNHEDYVIAQGQPDTPRSGPLFHVYRHTQWTYEQLHGDVNSLGAWPDFIYLEAPDKCEVRVAHGSMLGNTHGIFPMMDDEDLFRRVGEPLPTLFCCGHTHYPLITHLENTLVVNVGAVGLPFDRDRRGSYARFTWRVGKWEGEIVRVEYDYSKTMEDFLTSGFLHEAGSMAWLVLAEFLYASSQLFAWMRDYYEPVLAGETTVKATVQTQLEKQGLWEEIQAYL
jgi:predicted phosphodiesterase